ncbi:hypothetical protein GGR56DRAFT_650003 [Xylariaceae sp. FL0804]|nr:hypothetical protein GGR56DRAFT_650003 [Xylariaceae sp. FL0804]
MCTGIVVRACVCVRVFAASQFQGSVTCCHATLLAWPSREKQVLPYLPATYIERDTLLRPADWLGKQLCRHHSSGGQLHLACSVPGCSVPLLTVVTEIPVRQE